MIAADSIKTYFEQLALHEAESAYKAIFLSYYQRLIHFSGTIVHSKETAEEVVSDVFINLWTNRKSLLHIHNPHLYLYICTKNLSLTRLSQIKKEDHSSLEDVKVELVSLYYDPEQLMMTSDLFKKIVKAVKSLPPKCQLIFKLIKEDGLKYKDVAELLHLSPKTIENQMTIALRKIAASINLDTRRPYKEKNF